MVALHKIGRDLDALVRILHRLGDLRELEESLRAVAVINVVVGLGLDSLGVRRSSLEVLALLEKFVALILEGGAGPDRFCGCHD